MAEESKSGEELDLSNLDSLLQDLEKDLASAPVEPDSDPSHSSTPPAEVPELELLDIESPVMVTVNAPKPADGSRVSASAAPSAGVSDAGPTPAPHADPAGQPPTGSQTAVALLDESELSEPAEELLASPVRMTDRDDEDDDDMFTDDDEETFTPHPVQTHSLDVDRMDQPSAPEPPAPPQAVVSEAPAEPVPEKPAEPVAPAAETAFEDAIEQDSPPKAPVATEAVEEDLSFVEALEADEGMSRPMTAETPAPSGAAEPQKSAEALPVTIRPDAAAPDEPPLTPAAFGDALRKKDYELAARIGKAIRSTDSQAELRINLAGALFYADLRAEAEQELLAVLEQHPYHILARRNLEMVRAARA